MRLNFLYAVTWERLQSWKYVLYILEKNFKLCFVKFSEIASKKCKYRFSKFLSAGIQKRCRKYRFFGLEGTLITTDIKKKLKEKHPKVAELKQYAIIDKPKTKTENVIFENKL